jgi:hypothetical protein
MYNIGEILLNPYYKVSFFPDLYQLNLIKDALTIFLKSDRHDEDSLAKLSRATLAQQEAFIEILRMLIVHKAWIYQNDGHILGRVFQFKCKDGGTWNEDPETLEFKYTERSTCEYVMVPARCAESLQAA